MTTGFGPHSLECPGQPCHEWSPPDRRLIADDGRACVHCGVSAREHLTAATMARGEFFQGLRAPASCHGKVVKR